MNWGKNLWAWVRGRSDYRRKAGRDAMLLTLKMEEEGISQGMKWSQVRKGTEIDS